MSLRRRSSRLELLENIPVEFIKVIFILALVLFILCLFSLVLNILYPANLIMAVFTFVISLFPLITSWILLMKKEVNKRR